MIFSGMTLKYTDAKGVEQSFFAGTDYDFWNLMIAREGLQKQVAALNINVRGKYLNDLVDYYAVPTSHPVPVKPKMKVLPDVGEEYMTDFVPPLPDPVPVVPVGSGPIKQTKDLPPDRLTSGEQLIMQGLQYLTQRVNLLISLHDPKL